MTRLRADQLPAEVRRKLGIDDPPARARPSRAGVGDAEPCPGHCGCSQAFPDAAAWERHARRTGCRHWRILLPGEELDPDPEETP